MTHLRPDTIERSYFSIQEVASALSVEKSKIRFYDEWFELNLHRSGRGSRKITIDQIGDLAILVRLTEHLSIKSARDVFYRGLAQDVLELLEPEVPALSGVPLFIASKSA